MLITQEGFSVAANSKKNLAVPALSNLERLGGPLHGHGISDWIRCHGGAY